jgi:S1-C subfamily serine protease
LRVGDVVLEVSGAKPSSLADLFRHVWAVGVAGAVVPLKIMRDTTTRDFGVRSADRSEFLKKPHLH